MSFELTIIMSLKIEDDGEEEKFNAVLFSSFK